MPRKQQKRIAAADCETDPFKYGRTELNPFVWGFFDGETYSYFWGKDCTADFIHHLEDESDLIIYMHNGGKFDIYFLLPYLDPEVMLINGRIAKATLFGGRVEIRDSLLIMPIALSKYEKIEIDYAKFEPEVRETHKDEIIRYLNKDCTSLYRLCYEFVSRFGLTLTLASTAFKQLKKTGYDVYNTNETFDNTFRPFYFGGRVQCFSVGNFYGDFDYVDINSAYPRAMIDRHWFGPGFVEHMRLPEKDNGSWYATILAKSQGCLPFRETKESKLFFPHDDKPRIYNASGWEINYGLASGTLEIQKVLRVYKPALLNDFSEYVYKYYEEKKSAKEAGDFFGELFAKLLLNSAYGKFGQNGRQFEKYCIVEYGDWPENDVRWVEDQRWKFYCDLPSGHSVFCRADPSNRFYNVATAASVTAWVRSYLWSAIHQSDEPMYCDTDSLICKKFNGEIGDELGQWKLEAKLSEVHIAQRKMYAGLTTDGKHKVASKGVRLTFDQIKNGIKNRSNITFKKETPAASLKYGFRYFEKQISFNNLEKNVVNNPEEILQ